MTTDDKKHKLLELVREAAKQDKELREKYKIGDKFRFVRDRLQALLERLETNLKSKEIVKEDHTREVREDEQLVYVYLYNTQGMSFPSWKNMLSAKLFYEYSVNRPIYTEKKHIEKLIKSKENKLQHAYLTIALKQSYIIPSTSNDAFGNPLIKVKEGALKFDRLISFTHNNQDYVLDSQGNLIKK